MYKKILAKYNNNAERLMDILTDIQLSYGYISEEAFDEISKGLNISKVDIKQTVSFYHFFKTIPTGKYTVYLNDSAVANMMGKEEIAKAFEKETGGKFGSVTEDIGLFETACIGMNDQEPAAIINEKIFTSLTPFKVKEIVSAMKAGKSVEEMITDYGDGNNAHPLVKAMVKNNIMNTGPIIFNNEFTLGASLKKAIEKSPKDVTNIVKESNIRGRGGAGFPTGLKWELCSKAARKDKVLICNADEGEPGTFKDRVLLTEYTQMLLEGMTIASYAIGAEEGIIYLRAEYRYLQEYIESIIEELKSKNLLGKNILGKGFDFDIRIQIGAGAYVCGEETALIESMEGKRGEPRNKPPYPVDEGYLGKPTVVNNVATFCSVVRIIDKGAAWYKEIGTNESTGTKMLSISGDCEKAGVYEIEWGMTIKEMLDMVGAVDTMAVQIGGPSGACINNKQFDRQLSFEDLATGGSIIILNHKRDLLKDLVLNFTRFFADESCGSCVTCRTINVYLRDIMEEIVNGRGIKSEVDQIENWASVMSRSTRCGLGQTAGNPVLSTLKNFKEKYDSIVKAFDYKSTFIMEDAVADSCRYVDRVPNIHQ